MFLSDKEEQTIDAKFQDINNGIAVNIDAYSQKIIISHIETLLNYAERFYNRQFITRTKSSHQILTQLEALLGDYFNSENLMDNG